MVKENVIKVRDSITTFFCLGYFLGEHLQFPVFIKKISPTTEENNEWDASVYYPLKNNVSILTDSLYKILQTHIRTTT